MEKGSLNRHDQFRPNRGTVVALKMKIYKQKKDHEIGTTNSDQTVELLLHSK